MFSFFKNLLNGGPPPGVTLVDKFIEEAAELLFRCIQAQLHEAGIMQISELGTSRAFLLGYVATLAEQMGQRLKKEDPEGASVLISMLAMRKLIEAQSAQEALLREFTDLTNSRNHAFGQGGATALNDFGTLIQREIPDGLLQELQANRRV